MEFLFDKVEAAGIGWVRIDFVWALVESQPDLYEFGDTSAWSATEP